MELIDNEKYLNIKERNTEFETGLDIVKELYTTHGSQSAVISTNYANFLRLSTDRKEPMYIIIDNGIDSQRFQLRVSSIVSSSARFRFIDRQNANAGYSILVSSPTYARMSGLQNSRNSSEIPVTYILI